MIDINTWSQIDEESVSMRILNYIDIKKDPALVKAFQDALAANGVQIVEVDG